MIRDDGLARFPGMRTPSSDFRAVRTELQTGILMYELDLSSSRSFAAGSAQELKFAGNSLYIDKNTDVGNARIVFQDDSNVKPAIVYAQPGFIARVPWTRLFIENVAQAGKVLRILYGVDQDFEPGTSSDVIISGTVNVAEQGAGYGASYRSNVALAANTPETVFTPAANVNGAVVWSAQFQGFGQGGYGVYLAKTSAPANINDGDGILSGEFMSNNAATLQGDGGSLKKPIRIAAGKGLYFIASALQGSSSRSVLYTLI